MDKKDSLIEAQRAYIKFLGEQISSFSGQYLIRPYLAPSQEVIDTGKMLREKIQQLEKEQ